MDTLIFSKLQTPLIARYLISYNHASRLKSIQGKPGCPWINFNRLVDHHYSGLYRFAFSLARNKHEASDLVQQTFYIYAQKGKNIREPSKVKTWLFTTLYREFLKGTRLCKRQSVQENNYIEEVSAKPIDPKIFQSIDGDRAVNALKKIDEIYRVPLVLFFLQEYSYQEISDMLEIPIGTVMSRLSRGKKQLKRYFIREQKNQAVDSPLNVAKRQFAKNLKTN